MSGLLGKSGADSVAFHLGLEKVSGNPAAFHDGLTSMLGGPAAVIETMIIKSLYNKLGLWFNEAEGFDFVKLTSEARATGLAVVAGGAS